MRSFALGMVPSLLVIGLCARVSIAAAQTVEQCDDYVDLPLDQTSQVVCHQPMASGMVTVHPAERIVELMLTDMDASACPPKWEPSCTGRVIAWDSQGWSRWTRYVIPGDGVISEFWNLDWFTQASVSCSCLPPGPD